jgi:hypothetical protein
MKGLERLNDQMQAVGMSIPKAVSDGTLIINYDAHFFPTGNGYS